MKYKNSEYEKKDFTKDEIRKLIALWPTKTMDELTKEFQRPTNALQFVATKIRKAGVNLERKHGSGWGIGKMIQEVIDGK